VKQSGDFLFLTSLVFMTMDFGEIFTPRAMHAKVPREGNVCAGRACGALVIISIYYLAPSVKE
jgi:hypothetical protein